MRVVFLLFFAVFWAFAEQFCVASYNIENLFDAKKDGTEYKDYIPSKYGWSAEEAENKLQNVARVLRDLDTDIIAVQEVENDGLMKRLKNELGFEYYAFSKNPKSAVGLGILSRYEISKTQSFSLKGYEQFRPILHTKIKIGDEEISFFTNHFPSLKNENHTRVAYSNALKHYASSSGEKKQILLGDFNLLSYEDSPLSEAFGDAVYDLWNDIPKRSRWNYVYKGERNTLDRILVSKPLLEDKGINYQKKSFSVFKEKYLLNSKNAPKGNFMGFSDHLPIKACFE